MQINIEKQHLYIIAAIMIFLVGVGVVIAASTWVDKPMFHSSDDVKVKIGNDYHSLQSAIDNGLIGGGGGVSLGTWVNKSTSGGLVGQVNGPATTDGFVIASSRGCPASVCEDGNSRYVIQGYTDANNPPTTLRAQASGGDHEPVGIITMPVKKGHYWKVNAAITIWWIPLEGSGGGGGALACIVRNTTANSVSCLAGEVMVGGGCRGKTWDGISSYPSNSNTWQCYPGGEDSDTYMSYVICCTSV